MEVTTGKILKYAILPGILPRTQEFFSSGFSHVAAFTALALRAADLLPYNHPYLNPANMGRYGTRQALAEARRQLVFRRENIDQVIIYHIIMIGVFLVFFQFFMLALSFSFQAAHATTAFGSSNLFGPYLGTFFVTPNPRGDIAFMFLDWVFGYKNLYGSCVDPVIACPTVAGPYGIEQLHAVTQASKGAPGIYQWPSPFHKGLHMLFNFYDLGVAAVGMIMLTYMVTTVTAETAQTGIPFGKRFNKTWVLPRLVVASMLLFPWNPAPGLSPPDGAFLNGAQTITLFVAKWGSSLATNGWILFNNNLAGSTLAGTNQNNLVGKPNAPNYNVLLEFMLVAKVCKFAEERIAQEAGMPAINIRAYEVDLTTNPVTTIPMPSGAGMAGFDAAIGASDGFDIVLIFGEKRPAEYKDDIDSTKPVCGKLTVHVTDIRGGAFFGYPGAYQVQAEYYNIITDLWNDTSGLGMDAIAQQIVQRFTPGPDKDPNAAVPNSAWVNNAKVWMNNRMNTAVNNGRAAAAADPKWVPAVVETGWAGAAIWYNKISELNGSYIGAVYNLPSPDLYPELMEYIKGERKAHNADDSGIERYRPVLGDNSWIFYRKPGEDSIALALNYAQSLFFDHYPKTVGSPAADFIRATFGIQGVYNMLDNRDTHPLAKLVALGRALMQATAIQLAGRIGFGLVGLAGAQTAWGALAKGVGDTLASVAQITFMIGAVLYYIVPFMPFVYFFFAASAWVKAVFEAMVGMPLWALSFVRIDGDGLPGKSGMNGFYLLLDILIRPVLIVFGLLASVSIFAAQVNVLGEIWYLVETNVGGADTVAPTTAAATPGETGFLGYTREAIDGFCYTVIYTIVVYMLGMASFKLIDLIPAKILRWMGASVNTIGVDGDAGKEMTQTGESLIQQGYAGFNSGIFSLFARNSIPSS
jgi:conjugal transfer/type IV secretion protein DotA/TraY